jgi:DNA polymerase
MPKGAEHSNPIHDEHRRLIREFRQRLEALASAGVDLIPAPVLPAGSPYAVAVAHAATGAADGVETAAVAAPAPAAAPAVQPVNLPAAPVPAPPPPSRPPTTLLPQTPVSSLFGDEGMEFPPVAPAERPAQLAALAAEVAVCQRCPHLAAARTQTVFGSGSPTARLMFVGEAPGAEEDRTGLPFVGRAGQLLTDMVTKGMGLTRAEVYIANILKSRPPDNRTPLPDEVAHCLPYLERQIAIIRPEYLCLLGATAAQALLSTALAVGKLRSRWHHYRGIPAVVTYHPSYLLRNPAAKKDAWEDLQMLMLAMGLKPPGRRKPS